MATGPRRPRHHGRVPRRPRLGPRRDLRPRLGEVGHHLHPSGRVRVRRGRLRRRFLRDQPARGAGDGPAAAAAARSVLGDRGALRHRPHHPARQRDRCVRRRQLAGLRHRGVRDPRRRRGLLHHRRPDRRRLGPGLLHTRPGGPGDHRRHGLLILPRGAASRGTVPAAG